MDRTSLVGLSLPGGLALTPITSTVPLRTLLGSAHHGFPMAWLVRRQLPPGSFPWYVEWLGLGVDLVVWTAVVMVVLVLFERYFSTPAR
jgi:hypothetical protein